MLLTFEGVSVFKGAMAAESGENGQSDLESELGRLREEHRDLDGAIEALERSVAGISCRSSG